MANALKKADEYVTNALIGAGYGIQNQLEGMYQMAANPRETFAGFRNMLTNPRQIPGMVANSLVDSYRRAASGPLGFGEVIGENLSPSMFKRGPAKLDALSKAKIKELEALGFDTERTWFHATDNLANWEGDGFKKGSGWFADQPDAASAFYPSGAVVPVLLKKKIRNADGTLSSVPSKKEWAETVLVDDPKDIFMILPGR